MWPARGSWRTLPPWPPFALFSQSLIRGSTTSPYSFTDHLLVFGCGGREQRGEASLQNQSVVTPVLVLNSLTRKKIISDRRFPSASPQHSWGRDGSTTGSGAARDGPHRCPQHPPHVLLALWAAHTPTREPRGWKTCPGTSQAWEPAQLCHQQQNHFSLWASDSPPEKW